MRLKYLMLALVTLAMASCQEPPERLAAPNGSYAYGEETSEIGSDIVELSDGSFVLVGGQQDDKTGNYQLLVIKLDDQYREVWTRTIENSTKNEYARFVEKTNDGYAMIVYESPNQYGSVNVFFRKYSEDFELIGQSSIPAGENYSGNPVTGFFPLSNGGFLLGVPGSNEQRVFKLTPNGAVEEVVEMGTNYNAGLGNFITRTNEGGFIAINTNNYNAGLGRLYYFDENGNITRQISSPAFNNYGGVQGVSHLPNGNFAIIFGEQYNTQSQGIIMDSLGNFVEELDLDATGFFSHLFTQPDGKILLMGNAFSDNNYFGGGGGGQNNNILVFQKDSFTDDGDQTTIGGANPDKMRNVRLLSDGRYALIGQTQSYGAGALDVFLTFYQP